MSEHKFLRYGDHIYLTSNENPKSYLSARSILEERVFFIQAPYPDPAFSKEKVDSTLYENQAELVFAIYPKLNYQAVKNYNKLKGSEDSLKIELLKKRLGVEEDQNDKTIQKSFGTIVTFGSEVQLYHVSSKSFIRTTREKNPWKNDLYNIKLSKKGGSGMYFKIIPYLSFKREGEKISLKDLFFLENTKLQAAIVYKNIPEFPPCDTVAAKDDEQVIVNQQSFGRKKNIENKANTIQVPCMPILELTTTFTKYEAGLQQNVNRPQHDSKCPFQANSIYFRNSNLSSLVGSSKIICWGDYVRLKFMIDNKNAGYFYCDHTIIGDSPFVYCRTVSASVPQEKESFQAIFQIIPESEERYGAPIQFKTSKFVSLRLRHLLTGRYLMIGNADEKCTLSETLDEYIEQQSKQIPSKPNTEGALRSLNEDEILNKGGKGFKGQLKKQLDQPADKISNAIFVSKSGPTKQADSNPSLPSITNLIDKFRMRQPQEAIKKAPSADKKTEGGLSLNIFQSQQNLNPISEIVAEKEPGSIFQDPLQDLQLNEEDRFGPIKKFIERTRITMQNASQDEEEYLTTNSVFSLESQFLGVASLSVGSFLKEKAEHERAQSVSRTHPGAFQQFFHARFHKRNPLGKEEYEAVYSKQSDKYFHFSSVSAEEISEVLTIQSRLYPLVKVIQETKRKVEDNAGDRNQKNAAGEKGKKRNSLQTSGLKNTDLLERRQIIVAQALEAVKKLTAWLDGTDPSLDTGELNKKVKQKMFRELGVIDILFFILGKFFTKNFLKAEGKDLMTYKPLTQAIFSLLRSILLQNRVNNIYVFQWSQLQQEMTLSQTIASDLGVDKLLSQIFYENIIEIGELKAIPQHLVFKNYDLKALNIAIALYQFNPERSPKDRDQIISTLIINIDNRSRIFRKFVRDQLGDIIVENVDGEKFLRIDTSLEYRNKKEFDYTLGIVNLATEIAKSKPQVVCKHLSEYFPQELCTDIFESKKWNHLFRSGFLELFMEMYFAVATAQLPEISFPRNIKFLANVRVPEAINNMFQSRKDTVIRNFLGEQFDIKGFIHNFLNDPHKWAEDEHKYVQSVFKLIQCMCKKGLYNLTELRRLKQSLYNYLTIGLAVVHDEIMPDGRMVTNKTFTRKSSKLRSRSKTKRDTLKMEKGKDKKDKNNKKKGSSNKIEEKLTVEETTYLKKGLDPENKPLTYEQIPEDEEATEKDRGTTYWRKTEVGDMIQWMQEALNTLIFIENYELDNKLKEFFENDKSLRFFNEKLLNRTDVNEGFNAIFLSKIKKDKLDYVLKYMNDNFASQNYDHILLLLEMLLINNLNLTRPLVRLLYLNFSNYKQFLTGVNDAQIIYSSNVDTYERFYKIYDSLRFYEVELDSLYGRQIHTKSADIYVAIDLTLTELLKNLFEDTERLDRRGQLAYEKVVQIYEEYLFEPVSGREKQNLLLKLGFFKLVTDLFIPLVEGTNLKDDSKREKFLKNFLFFYVYFCFKNPENQQVMAKNNEFLESLFNIHFPSLQPLLLRLISDIYRDNYSLLINVSQTRPNVIQLLLKKFFEKFTWQGVFENSFFIYCLRIFPTFFQIRNNFLTHNQTFFANHFHSYVVQNKAQFDINYLLSTKLKQALVHNKFEDCTVEGRKELVKTPLEISFAIYFLNTFASMTTGPQLTTGQQSSNSNACLKNKSYLTIDEISYLIKNSGNWFNLKLALVRYLNEVYVKNKKLEDNEVLELYSVMRGTMFEEINEYLRFLKNRHLYGGWSLDQKFFSPFEEYYPIATEVKYGQLIDEVYHQYILYGVIDCFHFYSQRIKDEHSEEDHALLDDYVSSGLKDIHELWKSGIFQKKNTLSDNSALFLKHKMIAPLEEPTDPDINEGDIYNPQKNERKKVSQLKKEMTILREETQSLDAAVDIRISTLDKVEAHKGKSTNDVMLIDHQTIEKKHNNELEVLIKFLLESKEDEPWKFQMTIKSFMNLLASEDTSGEIKQLALKILRKLSNFKEDPELYEAIQLDFIQLNFIDFFDDIIINAKTEDDRLEFLLGMIDFLDDASPKIQQELYEILVKDEDNLLLETIARFIKTSFEEFRENEKNYDKQNEEIQQNAKSVVYKRMYAVVYALEFLRLACENHFEPMQHYLRDQVQEGTRNKRSINFISFIADIFSRYTKSVNELNARLGVQILDTLIEMLQGPCQENQIALCNTKVLETLEDLTVEVKKNRNIKEDLVWIDMNKKIIILIQAILEGSYNNYIVQQVAIHLNVSFFLERMMEAFSKTSKERNRAINKKRSHGKVNHFMTLDFLEGQLKDQGKYDATEVSYDALLHEGIELAIILNFLTDASPDIKQQVDTFKEKLEPEKLRSFLKAENFYNKYIGQIEIVNKRGDLQRIYFPIIKKTKYLSGVTKMKFLDEVKRESANEKLFGLLRYQKLFIDEMDHFLNLRQRGLRFSLTHFSRLRSANLILAFVTNLIILFSFKEDLTDDLSGESGINGAVRALGIAHIIISALVIIFWGIFKAPLDLKAGKTLTMQQGEFLNVEKEEDHEISGFTAKMNYWGSRAYYMVFDTYMVYLFLALLFSFLGTFYSIIFFAFLLIDIVDRSVILNNVVRAVTLNYKQLLMTFLLGILLIYIYAVIGYYSVVDDPELQEMYCSSVWHCFISVANEGLRAGGGIGEVFDENNRVPFDGPSFTKRYFFGLFHFLMIIVILLNIIFGIIIDTFAELRDQKQLKDYDETNRCFICNLERTLFEKEGKSFEKHARTEHSVWNYLHYMVYLKDKDKLEYNGTESYIYQKLQNDDLSWFPIQRAMSLARNTMEDEQDLKAVLDERLGSLERKMTQMFSANFGGHQSFTHLKSL